MKQFYHRFPWILGLLLVAGCAVKAPIPPPAPTPTVETPPPPPTLRSHVEGVWTNRRNGQTPGLMTLNPNGSVAFSGGLEFFNPGQWELNSATQELILTLPQAPNEKLSIFQMDVGEGVKAFDGKNKRITYHFDMQTDTLDIAGWNYIKEEKLAPVPTDAEPVLK